MSDIITLRERAEKSFRDSPPENCGQTVEALQWARVIAPGDEFGQGWLLGHITGAREEATIKNAKITEQAKEIASLQEVVRWFYSESDELTEGAHGAIERARGRAVKAKAGRGRCGVSESAFDPEEFQAAIDGIGASDFGRAIAAEIAGNPTSHVYAFVRGAVARLAGWDPKHEQAQALVARIATCKSGGGPSAIRSRLMRAASVEEESPGGA